MSGDQTLEDTGPARNVVTPNAPHVWIAATTTPLTDRQARLALLRGSVHLPERAKVDVLEVYCFAGETEFGTRDGGVRTMKDTVGTSQMVLTQQHRRTDHERSAADGHWVEADIVSFGQQPLLSVVLTREGESKTIRATASHRWFASVSNKATSPSHQVSTVDLQPGMILSALTPSPTPGRSGSATFPAGDLRYDRGLRWEVESVTDHGDAEEVFCADVPDTESFVLTDAIWTHNCAACKRPMEDVGDDPCSAVINNEHLRGGPIGERRKRKPGPGNHQCIPGGVCVHVHTVAAPPRAG